MVRGLTIERFIVIVRFLSHTESAGYINKEARCACVLFYAQMQGDLESEKRAMLKIWKKREKQISIVVDNAVEMRGEIEGLVSGYKVLPSVDELELGSIGEDE